MTLSTLKQKVFLAATAQQRDHGGFANKDGTFSSVPYQIITHLFSSPIEYNELKRLSYAGATSPRATKDPYHPDFAKAFNGYIKDLNDILSRIGQYSIVNRKTMSGARFFILE